MGSGGVYDQIAGGFHRYSVDERWCVPHFEKMSYDNSELLKNFLHGYQVTREPFFREIAEGIIDWTNAVLSDQSRGGFYASQDADQTLDDDGDYFTWTLDEVRAVLTPEESRVVELRYDVEAARRDAPQSGEKCSVDRAVHRRSDEDDWRRHGNGHGPADLWRARRENCWRRARRGPRRLWTRLFTLPGTRCIVSAYLDAAAVLGGEKGAACRAFALKTLDRMLARSLERRARIRASHGRRAPRRIARRSDFCGDRAARRL